jgi:hypothetical protein
LKGLGIDGRIILKLILKKQYVRVLAGVNWLRIWADSGEHSIKGENFMTSRAAKIAHTLWSYLFSQLITYIFWIDMFLPNFEEL